MGLIDLNQEDKDNTIPENKISGVNARQLWKLYRDKAIAKINALSERNTGMLLYFMLIILVKIYWELRKPKKGE